jgi:hypothetical protein
MQNLDALFDDKRVLSICIATWTLCVTVIFVCIMIDDNSPFLSFGPNERTVLFGVKVDTWTKWGCIALYTFVATCIADFTSDAVGPFVTNTIQDHKNLYLPYSKTTCVMIVQVFAVYAIIMNTIGLFVALSQVDFMMIRMAADLMVNYYTCHRFMRYKSVNEELYQNYIQTHCVDAVHFEGANGLPNDTSYSSTPRTVTPQPEAKHAQKINDPKMLRTASPVEIRRAASASSRTPSSDDFDGMRKQSTVELNAESLRLYAQSLVKEESLDVINVYSPSDREDDKSTLFGTSHYT